MWHDIHSNMYPLWCHRHINVVLLILCEANWGCTYLPWWNIAWNVYSCRSFQCCWFLSSYRWWASFCFYFYDTCCTVETLGDLRPSYSLAFTAIPLGVFSSLIQWAPSWLVMPVWYRSKWLGSLLWVYLSYALHCSLTLTFALTHSHNHHNGSNYTPYRFS